MNSNMTRIVFANQSAQRLFIRGFALTGEEESRPSMMGCAAERRFPSGGLKSISNAAIFIVSRCSATRFSASEWRTLFSVVGKICISVYDLGDLKVMRIESRLLELGITLPPTPAPGGIYTPVVVVDHLAYVSGQVPYGPDGKIVTGRVGSDMTEEQGAAAARTVALTMLATIKASLGTLDRVKRIVKVLGFVNCTPEFQKHPAVMNGFSNTMVEIFGDAGKAARSAVGMGSLPFNVPVEVEAVLELHP